LPGSGLAGACGLDDLAADDLGVVGVLEQPVGELLAHDLLDRAAHLAGDQLVLGLAGELGLGHLDADHAGQALAHVVAGDLDLGLLGQLVVLDVLVDDAGHRRAQAGQVGATVALRDVVGEAEDALAVAVVPLHRHLDADGGVLLADALADGVEDVRMQDLLALVDELDEALDPAGEGEVVFLAVALVDQADLDAVVQERELAQALGQHVVVEVDVGEDLVVGQEVHLGAALVGVAEDLHRADLDAVTLLDDAVLRHALLELEVVHLAVAAHGQAQPLGQRVDARHAHAVQAARDLVAVLVELAAGVQLGQGDLRRRTLGLVLVVHLDAGRDAAAVVDDGDGVVGVDGDDDVVAVAGQRLVDRVVDDLEDQVMQTGAIGGVADVHAGALAHRFQPFEDLDAAFAVAGFGRVLGGLTRLLVACVGHEGLDSCRWGLWPAAGPAPSKTLERAASPLGVGHGRRARGPAQIRIGITTYLKPA
jgi:hypothetical protein